MSKLILILLLGSLHTFAAVWAVVTVPKAIVYADVEMTSAIGYIVKGKKIRVGEVKRGGGEVLPIVVNRKIVYVRVEDIQYEAKRLEPKS